MDTGSEREKCEVKDGEMMCMFPKEYLMAFLSSGIRPDGRNIHGGREVTVNVGSVSTANGSALVRFGDTLVVCGVKAELVEATPTSFDTPIVCNVEVPPCSRLSVSAGPPTTATQAVTQTIQNVILRSVDVQQLMISEDNLHWVLYVDVICLCDDGNLLDSACFAAVSALSTTLLPSVDSSSGVPVVSLKHTSNVKLTKIPIFVSFAVMPNGSCLLDPDLPEEELAESTISYCFADGSITQLIHTGEGLSSDLLLSMGKVAECYTQNLFKLLHEAIH